MSGFILHIASLLKCVKYVICKLVKKVIHNDVVLLTYKQKLIIMGSISTVYGCYGYRLLPT